MIVAATESPVYIIGTNHIKLFKVINCIYIYKYCAQKYAFICLCTVYLYVYVPCIYIYMCRCVQLMHLYVYVLCIYMFMYRVSIYIYMCRCVFVSCIHALMCVRACVCVCVCVCWCDNFTD